MKSIRQIVGRSVLTVIAFFWGVIGTASAATSVSQYGITWTFDSDKQVGQFANGDWWVVGPVRITSITPKDTDETDTFMRWNGSGFEPAPVDMHGSMLGPTTANDWPVHGFDSRVDDLGYYRDLNIARQLPYVVPIHNSVISSISRIQYSSPAHEPQIDVQAVLTVLSAAPPSGSFRPPFLGADKTIKWNKSQIDYSKLKRLAVLAGSATPSSLAGSFQKTMFNLGNQYKQNYLLGYQNTPYAGKNYGREISSAVGLAAITLNLDYSDAEKEALTVNLVQHGLDIYGGVLAGQKFYANGGQAGGRKLPMVLAGMLLNDANIKARCNAAAYPDTFAEDAQHFYVSQNDIDTPRWVDPENRPIEAYTQAMLGMPEWGADSIYQPTHSGSNWNVYYRSVACPPYVGNALACMLMGIRDVWGRPAFFDYYAKRYVPTERNNGTIDTYVLKVWDAYATSAETSPEQTSKTSSQAWQNFDFGTQSNGFVAGFDVVPNTTQVGGSVGLTTSPAADYSDLVCMFRLSLNGWFDAKNGDMYQAVNTVRYSEGTRYRVVMQVNPGERNFSVVLIQDGGSVISLADRWRFTSTQSGGTSFSSLNMIAYGGQFTISNFKLNAPQDKALYPAKPKGISVSIR